MRHYVCRFFERHGFEHVSLLSADGALEAAPAMGAADIILDLVSTGVTLRENNLKTIENGNIMEVIYTDLAVCNGCAYPE